MLARPLLSQLSALGPPWPAAWVSLAHNNDYAGGGSFDNYLHAFTSPDGIAWTALAPNTQGDSIVPSLPLRDPALIHWKGRWRCLCSSASDFLWLTTSGAFADSWTAPVAISTAGVGATASWASQWFVDVDGSLHVVMPLQVSGTFALYEMHPTNDAMTTWSTPVLITGTGWPGNSIIDPSVTYWAGTYYLLYKDDVSGYINLATSSSPFTGYTTVRAADWAGWGPGSIEGPQIVDIGTGWRIYFSQNSAYDANAIYYSETTDRTMLTGWSARTSIASFSGYNHPLPIKRPA